MDYLPFSCCNYYTSNRGSCLPQLEYIAFRAVRISQRGMKSSPPTISRPHKNSAEFFALSLPAGRQVVYPTPNGALKSLGWREQTSYMVSVLVVYMLDPLSMRLSFSVFPWLNIPRYDSTTSGLLVFDNLLNILFFVVVLRIRWSGKFTQPRKSIPDDQVLINILSG